MQAGVEGLEGGIERVAVRKRRLMVGGEVCGTVTEAEGVYIDFPVLLLEVKIKWVSSVRKGKEVEVEGGKLCGTVTEIDGVYVYLPIAVTCVW